ncbi:MAG TPA: hypothetical protein ENJ32_05200 [Crenotrichaceae bacterium]|nr:hypothetical protein [Crenotrichaceae bacterium]
MHIQLDTVPEQFSTLFDAVNIASEVTGNLSEMGYSFTKSDTEHYSHQMQILVGNISHRSTPPGFSFNAGNSNPRALDFQKAQTLPITCRLMSVNNPQQQTDLTMNFTAKPYLAIDSTTRSPSTVITTATKHFVNDISTVCFNLLSNRKIKNQQPVVTDSTPQKKWMPDIEIRTIDEPSATKNEVVDNKNSVNKSSSHAPSVKTVKPATLTNTVKAQPGKNKQRKQLIIHNQGSPLEIEFGYQRK